jgi:hypothetical protein
MAETIMIGNIARIIAKDDSNEPVEFDAGLVDSIAELVNVLSCENDWRIHQVTGYFTRDGEPVLRRAFQVNSLKGTYLVETGSVSGRYVVSFHFPDKANGGAKVKYSSGQVYVARLKEFGFPRDLREVFRPVKDIGGFSTGNLEIICDAVEASLEFDSYIVGRMSSERKSGLASFIPEEKRAEVRFDGHLSSAVDVLLLEVYRHVRLPASAREF